MSHFISLLVFFSLYYFPQVEVENPSFVLLGTLYTFLSQHLNTWELFPA